MKIAWLMMIIGALCTFQGVALLFTGYHAGNFWIILTGVCIGGGAGVFPLQYGWKRRKELLLARRKA